MVESVRIWIELGILMVVNNTIMSHSDFQMFINCYYFEHYPERGRVPVRVRRGSLESVRDAEKMRGTEGGRGGASSRALSLPDSLYRRDFQRQLLQVSSTLVSTERSIAVMVRVLWMKKQIAITFLLRTAKETCDLLLLRRDLWPTSKQNPMNFEDSLTGRFQFVYKSFTFAKH